MPRPTSSAWVGPERTATRPWCDGRKLALDHLGEAQEGVALEALGAMHDQVRRRGGRRQPGGQGRAGRPKSAPGPRPRSRRQPPGGSPVGRMDGSGRHAWQVRLVDAAGGQGRRELGRLVHRRTRWPARASTTASAVPQPPALRTATCATLRPPERVLWSPARPSVPVRSPSTRWL